MCFIFNWAVVGVKNHALQAAMAVHFAEGRRTTVEGSTLGGCKTRHLSITCIPKPQPPPPLSAIVTRVVDGRTDAPYGPRNSLGTTGCDFLGDLPTSLRVRLTFNPAQPTLMQHQGGRNASLAPQVTAAARRCSAASSACIRTAEEPKGPVAAWVLPLLRPRASPAWPLPGWTGRCA